MIPRTVRDIFAFTDNNGIVNYDVLGGISETRSITVLAAQLGYQSSILTVSGQVVCNAAGDAASNTSLSVDHSGSACSVTATSAQTTQGNSAAVVTVYDVVHELTSDVVFQVWFPEYVSVIVDDGSLDQIAQTSCSSSITSKFLALTNSKSDHFIDDDIEEVYDYIYLDSFTDTDVDTDTDTDSEFQGLYQWTKVTVLADFGGNGLTKLKPKWM